MASLRAEFEFQDGKPVFAMGEKYKHYRIKLSVVDVPSDVLTIIYQLDASYENPVRMVTRGVPDFQEYITAYYDYEIGVLYRPIDEPTRLEKLLSVKLSEALRQTYRNEDSTAVAEAIGDIERH